MEPVAVPSRVVPSTVACLACSACDAEHVSLVGVVESELIESIFLDFVLNDATGRVRVRYIYPPPFWQLPELAGRYVRLCGRVLPGDPCYIITESVALIKEADEVSYHLIEVAHRHLVSRQ